MADLKDDEVRNELLMHMAKTVVASGIGYRHRVFELFLGLVTFLIPGYPAVLVFLGFSRKTDGIFVFAAPIGLWLVCVAISSFAFLPKTTSFDLKNISGILKAHEEGLLEASKLGKFAALFLVGGIVVAAIVIAGHAPH